jgi:peptidoglycan-associated lipoprotein
MEGKGLVHVFLHTIFLIVFISIVPLSGCSKKAVVKDDSAISVTKAVNANQHKAVLKKSDNLANKRIIVKKDVKSEKLEDEKLTRSSLTSKQTEKSDAELKKDSIRSQNKLSELQKVYFDYDRSEIRKDAKKTLQKNADILKNNIGNKILIEGHCDERGTDEYNLALGEKRAESVKKFLASLGITDMRMNTISYGESKPEAIGSDEVAWKLNRRAILKEVKE